jgi:hypothetical protein
MRLTKNTAFGWIWEPHSAIETQSATPSIRSLQFSPLRPLLLMSCQISIPPAVLFVMATHRIFLDPRLSIIESLSIPHNGFQNPPVPSFPVAKSLVPARPPRDPLSALLFSSHSPAFDPRSPLSHRIFHQPLLPSVGVLTRAVPCKLAIELTGLKEEPPLITFQPCTTNAAMTTE